MDKKEDRDMDAGQADQKSSREIKHDTIKNFSMFSFTI